MTLRYIVELDPGQVSRLAGALRAMEIPFDPTLNLTGMSRDSADDAIFLGSDLDWLPAPLNEQLGRQPDIELVGLPAQQDLLRLATLHTDWGTRPEMREPQEINEREWAAFVNRNPDAVHHRDEPPPGPPGPDFRNVPVNLSLPMLGAPDLESVLQRAVLDIERDIWSEEMEPRDDLGDAEDKDPWDRDEPILTTAEILETVPSVHLIINGLHHSMDLPDHIRNELEGLMDVMADRIRNEIPAGELEALRARLQSGLQEV